MLLRNLWSASFLKITKKLLGFTAIIALADNSSACMQVGMKGTGSRFVGSQFIFHFNFHLKIFNNSYFMLTCFSAYLRVSRLLMITRLGIWRMTSMIEKSKE